MNVSGSSTADAGQAAPQRIDASFVTYRLEEAGATLLALPSTGYSTRLRASKLDFVANAAAAFDGKGAVLRAPVPSASRITRMDEALGWIVLIPQERYVIRRIVGARSLVSPVTERHLYSWRRLGTAVGADHKAVQRWHAQGIDMLVAALGALQQAARPPALPWPCGGGRRVQGDWDKVTA
jgi:hypothetical protein